MLRSSNSNARTASAPMFQETTPKLQLYQSLTTHRMRTTLSRIAFRLVIPSLLSRYRPSPLSTATTSQPPEAPRTPPWMEVPKRKPVASAHRRQDPFTPRTVGTRQKMVTVPVFPEAKNGYCPGFSRFFAVFRFSPRFFRGTPRDRLGVARSGEVRVRRGCREDVLLEVLEVLHVGVHDVEPVPEDVGVGALERTQR